MSTSEPNDSIVEDTQTEDVDKKMEQPAKKSKLSEDRLAKLSKARERAAEVNRRRKEDRLRAKVAALDAPPKVKQDQPPPMDPVVVVEQSDSDPEQLEGPPGVLFVRRKRPKPLPPEKTPEDLHMDRMYKNMFG